MKTKPVILLALTICLFQSAHAGKLNIADTLYAAQLKPYGRYSFNKQHELELISSAVHFGFKFNGSQCAIYASPAFKKGHNYIQYELDGVYQQRILISSGSDGPVVIKTPSAGVHTIWIYKATEAHTGAVIISKIAAAKIKPLTVPKAPLIEFIGNSITCGAAADTADLPCGAGAYQDHHNAYMAYGPRLARELGMNYVLSSVSGIGVYRTWNSDGPAMPEVYERIDLQINNPQKWDFKNYTPKIVSIALGTNDLSNGDGKTPRKPFSEEEFNSKYIQFIRLIKSRYPKARIVLLSSPMIKGATRTKLEKCLTVIKDQINKEYMGDQPAETFFFAPMDARGCSGHPSVADHLILANELKPFFKKLME